MAAGRRRPARRRPRCSGSARREAARAHRSCCSAPRAPRALAAARSAIAPGGDGTDPRERRVPARSARGARGRRAAARRRPAGRRPSPSSSSSHPRHAAARRCALAALALASARRCALAVAARRRRRSSRSSERRAAAADGEAGRSRRLRAGGEGITRRRAAAARRRRRRRRRWPARRSLPVAALGPSLGAPHARHAVAARAGGSSTTDGRAAARRRHRGRLVLTALPRRRRPASELGAPVIVVRVDPRQLRLPRGAPRLGAGGHPRVLEDLHARRLRGLAVPLPASTARPSRARRSSARATTRRSTSARGGDLDLRPRRRGPLPQLPLAHRPPTAPAWRPAAASGTVGPSWWDAQPVSARRAGRRRAPCAASTSGSGGAPACARRCATCSPTTGRSCSARSRCTRSWSSSLTGIFLALFFARATRTTHLPRAPTRRCAASRVASPTSSALHLSFDVPAGLLMRQTHHWAADVFVVAIVAAPAADLLHRRLPEAARAQLSASASRCSALAILEGFAGYSLLDDLLSGMGLAIAYSVALSIPLRRRRRAR